MDTTTYTGATYAAKATCDTCGAVVPQRLQGKHTAWHLRVDRLLEHTERPRPKGHR